MSILYRSLLVYVYVYMLSLRRDKASAYVAGAINMIVGVDQRVAESSQSCTAGSIWSRTTRVHLTTICMQDRHDDFLPDH